MTVLLSLAVVNVGIQREPVDKRGNDAFAGDRVSGGIGGDFDRLPHGVSIHQIRGERADERVAGPGAVYGGEVSGRIVTLDILAAQVAAVFSLGDDDAARAAFEKMRGLQRQANRAAGTRHLPLRTSASMASMGSSTSTVPDGRVPGSGSSM